MLDGGEVAPGLRRPHRVRGRHGRATRSTTTPTTGTPTARPPASAGRHPAQEVRLPHGARACSTPAARRSRPPGSTMPWYAAFGNHDQLMQGNFPHNDAASADRAVGDTKVTTKGVRGRSRADPDRRLLSRARDRSRSTSHHRAPGRPRLHRSRTATPGTAYYTFDQGPIRFIVLDTVNPNGDADGLHRPAAVRLAQGAAGRLRRQARDHLQPPHLVDHGQPAIATGDRAAGARPALVEELARPRRT